MSAQDVDAGDAVGVPEACPGGPGSELAGKAAVSERQSIAERCVNRFLCPLHLTDQQYAVPCVSAEHCEGSGYGRGHCAASKIA
jgi:hypothetical protein